ncbi:MAG TPA: hypothetical protein VGC95_11565, partial [Chitinophagaceae bacterium]
MEKMKSKNVGGLFSPIVKPAALRLVVVAAIAWMFICMFVSCKREITVREMTTREFGTAVKTWLEQQKSNESPVRRALIDSLWTYLEPATASSATSISGQRWTVTNINEDFCRDARIDVGRSAILLTSLDADGQVRQGNIVVLDRAPVDTKSLVHFFCDAFASGTAAFEGNFDFLTPGGKPVYRLRYQDHRLRSSAIYERTMPANTARIQATLCYDWYLVTTWYDANGNVTDQTRVFLYTSCGACGSPKVMSFCSTDEIGGADCCIPDRNAQLTSTGVSLNASDACGIESVDPLTGTRQKTCTHSWFFRSTSIMWYNWKYGSTEKTVEQKTATGWVFKSANHESIYTSGTVPPCMTSTCTVVSSNVFYSGSVARIDLRYNITFT